MSFEAADILAAAQKLTAQYTWACGINPKDPRFFTVTVTNPKTKASMQRFLDRQAPMFVALAEIKQMIAMAQTRQM